MTAGAAKISNHHDVVKLDRLSEVSIGRRITIGLRDGTKTTGDFQGLRIVPHPDSGAADTTVLLKTDQTLREFRSSEFAWARKGSPWPFVLPGLLVGFLMDREIARALSGL